MERPLSDEEIAKKYGIDPKSPFFSITKALSRSRPDTTINDIPMYTCPHCGEESQKDDYYDVETGDEWECPKCERTMFVAFVDHTIQVTLSTHKDD